ncbi:L-threonylcarbamoyladenylate synthase [Nitrosospira sp. Is2]|uniref:L-threonylcarbamoyladenylate synthase n=1 Tax=Nitrosospira sp. Is2 TaxID=3080532 RepID=UPI002953BD06|nr:L-threonylcarbamoyladenylate synthase [Nitrosospira sp. Is2]WON74790.1 L-threonylcarbamoyladenylate synthase [Nitrosospira sp. Is2]
MIAAESYSLQDEIIAAATVLREGGVVAFPTETVYGLGAEISNSSAVRRVFEIKKRPADHPLIVHFADASRLNHWAREVPEQALRLAELLWPGPLTLILPRSRHVPANVTGGQDTVGLRVPDHPVALALLHELGPERAVAAPSANRFGRISPTTAAHVKAELGDAVDMILDGGPCRIGLESTIVGFEGKSPVILRPGTIPMEELAEILGETLVLPPPMARTVRVPGALASHYAPATPLELWRSELLWQRALELEADGWRVAVVTWSPKNWSQRGGAKNKNVVHFSMPAEPVSYGRQLYASLRQLDSERLDRLLVEIPPAGSAWAAIADRLRRASGTPSEELQSGAGIALQAR